MVGNELHDEEVQSLRDLVEEAAKAPPQKTKKKKTRKDEASLNKAHERILSFVTRRRGEDEVKVGYVQKLPQFPKRIKGKKKFLNQNGIT